MSGLVTRRDAMHGAAIAALGLSAIACAPVEGHAAPLSTSDARLVAILAELTDLDRFLAAYPAIGMDDEEEDHPAYYEALDAVVPLEDEMAELPADTMTGVLAKVRAQSIPTCGSVENGLADGVCADLLRLFGRGALS